MDFEERLKLFLKKAQEIVDADRVTCGIRLVEAPRKSKKYIKIISTEGLAGVAISAWCFIDRTNGNILKSNSFSAPHPTPRGSIYADDCGASAINTYGAKYLK